MFNVIKKSMEVDGRTLSMETGRMARQANGSVLITFEDTVLLVTATASKEPREGIDFFPLIVDFNEKMYASGKIPGGFIKREALPSLQATLNARMIDRSIRPLFPDGFRNEIQIILTTLSYDGSCDLGALGIIGASAALSISDIPFIGPIAGAAVGYKDGEYKIFPDDEYMKETEIGLIVAGSKTSVCMIESSAIEKTEDEMRDAVYFGHNHIKKFVEFQEELIAECAKEKMEVVVDLTPQDILDELEAKYGERINSAAHTLGKHDRENAFDAIKKEVEEIYTESLGEEVWEEKGRYYKSAIKELIKKHVRHAILFDKHRADGRGTDDIRQIVCEVDIAPRVHGSALFTRGETQSLGAVTLGSAADEKIIDGLGEEYKKRFYLHYNFPPFSVGEVGFMRGPGRRDLGHGMLAERSLAPLLPSKDDFPYAVRIVSDILESNGSSSMATVCSGSMAMMAAGVPLKRAVAGIANGLIMEDGEYVVLTDIMGLEDHLGDMDFKVAGTTEGITALQMDIKIEGITKDIMTIALEKAKVARMHILGIMDATISVGRTEVSQYAPQIESFPIPSESIGEVIGPGGKMIKSIIEKTGVQINIDDDGICSIASSDKPSIAKAVSIIKSIVFGPQPDVVYEGEVVRVEGYGVFVRIMDGYKEGMVHISNMTEGRLSEVTDMCNMGDTVYVKFLRSERGKIALTMKGVEGNKELGEEYFAKSANAPRTNYDNRSQGGRGGRDNRGGRDSRGGRDNYRDRNRKY
ncbi:MAG: polyribonucleotide nucleotidyltransferase [Candidatus Cloacimonetes bacterium]|nr:polyribonucleotide nucleotidyltransferase [Candidatus Cloacimonadota bacterium]